jgi:hypothetical protein
MVTVSSFGSIDGTVPKWVLPSLSCKQAGRLSMVDCRGEAHSKGMLSQPHEDSKTRVLEMPSHAAKMREGGRRDGGMERILQSVCGPSLTGNNTFADLKGKHVLLENFA